MKAERVSSLFWLAFGLLCIYGSINLGLGTIHEPGSGFLPFLASCFICLMALVVLLQTLFAQRPMDKISSLWKETSWRRPLAIAIILVGYIFSLERLGFLLTSMAILFLMFKGVEKLSWLKATVISVTVSLGAFLLFTKILKATLPRGFLGF